MSVNSIGACVMLPGNCTKAEQDNVCTTCDTGFYVDTTGQCSILSTNCTSADP
jgi:hypothetical protein